MTMTLEDLEQKNKVKPIEKYKARSQTPQR
jgi:hypothetical protein